MLTTSTDYFNVCVFHPVFVELQATKRALLRAVCQTYGVGAVQIDNKPFFQSADLKGREVADVIDITNSGYSWVEKVPL